MKAIIDRTILLKEKQAENREKFQVKEESQKAWAYTIDNMPTEVKFQEQIPIS